MRSATLETWIDHLQAEGRYTFSRAEAVTCSGLSVQSVGRALCRLVRRGRLIQPREYFFVIVPLEYRATGAPPASWFVHELMSAMDQPYYVALLSAAALHEAAHHQPQVFQVMTDRSVRPITAGRVRILFYACKYVKRVAAMSIKTPTGAMRVSTPEATVVDLVRFSKSAGFIDHAATVIADLTPRINAKHLIAALETVSDIPNTQRLGYLLDMMGCRRLADPVHRWAAERIERSQRLRTGEPIEDSHENARWRLWINRPVEFES